MSRRNRVETQDLDPEDLDNNNDPYPHSTPSYHPHRSNENTYIDPNYYHDQYQSLTPSSPTYQLATRFPTGWGKRRLSRAQEMALVERKGERRVSPGLRVEGGGLRRIDLEDEKVGGLGDRLEEGEGGLGRGALSIDEREGAGVQDLGIESSYLEDIGVLQPGGSVKVDIGINVEDSLPVTPLAQRQHDKLDAVEIDRIEGRDDELRSPETPARLDAFEITKHDPILKQSIDTDKVFNDTQTTTLPRTPNARPLRKPNPFPTSISTPIPLPSNTNPSSNLPGAPKKTRSSSISSFLSSLKQSATKPFFPSWTSVGHKSGVPERLVVVSSIPDEGGQARSQKEGKKLGLGVDLGEVVVDGWTRDIKVDGGKGWKRSPASDYGWGDDDQEEGWEQEVVDVREELADIANRTALGLEEGQDEDEGDEGDSGALGVVLKPDHRDSWRKFEGDDRCALAGFVEDGVGQGVLDETIPIQALETLKLSSTPPSRDETQQTGQLPTTAPPRKIIHYRHIIHLASNAMLEPRPERIVYHSLFERVIRVSGVDFNNAVMSILMEVSQGRLGQDHYTLHDLYTWYKVTFRKKRLAEDTLQALLLALIQVSTGRPLGEREEATLQALQGNSTILCAIPMGYCFVHAKVYDSKTASALAEDLEGEVVGNQEMVSPELDQASDISSDVESGRDIPLTPPATPKRRMDKGKGRALDDDDVDNDMHRTVGGLAPEDTPPRPSSALPISDTQYSVFPRIIGMVSKKLQVTTELALFQPEVERALTFAGITCEQFQEVMFKAQELDQDEMNKRWEEREFMCLDGRWQASRYFEAIAVVSPFGAAVHVRQLPAFQRALIYLMMMCFDWPEDQPEEFIIRLENEHRLIVDHSPYKPDKTPNKPLEHKTKPSETMFFESPEQWLEITRVHQLQIGPSTKVWQPTSTTSEHTQ